MISPSWKILPRSVPLFLSHGSSFPHEETAERLTVINQSQVFLTLEIFAGTFSLKKVIIDFSISLAFNVLVTVINTNKPLVPGNMFSLI